MFERQVTGLLTQLLGNYVEPSCFRHDKVNVGVWSGYVVLQHLELQRKIYPSLGVAVVRGVLGQVTIKIPWNRLVYDSVLVTIDDVYILLRNVNREDMVPPTAEMEQMLKKQLIDDLYQQKLETDKGGGSVDDSFLLRLRTKILDNLEFHIRRIHIRFQDATSGDHPFTFGLTEPMIYKSFELNHLSMYLNPDCALHGDPFFDGATCSLDTFTNAFSRSIPMRLDMTRPPSTPQSGRDDSSRHHFILKPVNASAHFKTKRDPTKQDFHYPNVPTMELQVLIDEVALQLEECQYCDMLFLLTALKTPQQAQLYEQYFRFRPIVSVFQAPAAWWRYAIQCIQSDVAKKRTAWSWVYMKERRDDRLEYVMLWQRLQLAEMPEHFLGDDQAQEIQKQVDAIEARRSVEDVLLFRYLADLELKQLHPATSTSPTAAAAPTTLSSYSLWNLVRWTGLDYSSVKEAESGQEMERQELYRILGYDPMEKAAPTTSNDFSVISIQLNQGSVALLNDPDTKYLRTSSQYSRSYNPQPFFMAMFAQVEATFLRSMALAWYVHVGVMQVHTDIVQRSGANMKMELSLQTVELYDESMDGYCIMKRRVPMSTLNVEITMVAPVFRMSYENGQDQQMLKLFMEPLEIIYSPTAICWAHLSTFSTAPEALGLWAEMEMQALNEFVNFKARTEAKVEYAMAHRIPVLVDVRIQAPVIILPSSDGDMLQHARLILDLGHVHFRTERLSNLNVNMTSTTSTTHGHQRAASVLLTNSTNFSKQLTDEAETGEEEFYDKFTCAMSNLHVMLLPPAVPYSPELLMHSTTPFSLVDPFHINVTMRKSVLPLDATLYQLYVHVDLPALAFHVSMGQYHHLCKVLARFKHQEASTTVSAAVSTSALLTPRFPPQASPWSTDNHRNSDEDETQSVMSDDTWFSVEYGNDGQGSLDDVEDRLSLPTGLLAPPPLSSQSTMSDGGLPPTIPVAVPAVPSIVPGKCRPDPTTVVPSTRIVKKILDRRVCVCTVTIPIVQIHFQKAEDESAGRVLCVLEGIKLRFAKRTLSTTLRLRLGSLAVDDHANNAPTHHLLFSVTTQPVLPYTSLLPKTSRRGSLRPRKASSHNRMLPPLPSSSSGESMDLLDINLTSEVHDPTELDITFGHLHVQFDQSRIAALVAHVLPLFQQVDDPKDAVPPMSLNDMPIDLSSSGVVPSDVPTMSLTDSVRLDLEKARHALFHQAKKDDEASSGRNNVYKIKVHMRSLVGNIQVIDLVSSDQLHMKRKDKRFLFQEVLGLASPLVDASPLATATLSQSSDKGHIKLHVEQVRCIVSTRFLLKLLHYICEGPLMDALSCPQLPRHPAPLALSHHLDAYHHHIPTTPGTAARDVFFSPVFTFDTVPHHPPRPLVLHDRLPPPMSTSKWSIAVDMHDPLIVMPLHKSAKHPSLELTHGIVLQLGLIRALWSPSKVRIFLRPMNIDFELNQPRRVRVHLSHTHVQVSEVHTAMLVELYFQGFLPLSLYHQPPNTPSLHHQHHHNVANSSENVPWHLEMSCDALAFSIFTVRTDHGDTVVQGNGEHDEFDPSHGLVFDMFAIHPHGTIPVATLAVGGIQGTVNCESSQRSMDLSFAHVTLQDTVVSPGCTFQYRHTVAKHVHSWWVDAKAIRLVVEPLFVERVVVVGLETMTNVEHSLMRHQNQLSMSELASSVYDDAESEYQWTERGRSNSIASSIHGHNAIAPATTPQAAWHFDVGCKLVEIELESLVLAGQVACKQDPSQLFVRLQNVLVKTKADDNVSSNLLHPLEITLRYQPTFPVDAALQQTLSPFHTHKPDTLLYTSLQCSPVFVSVHLQDIQTITNSISTVTTLAATMDGLLQKLRPVATDVFHHASTSGDTDTDSLQYSLIRQLSEDGGPCHGVDGRASHAPSTLLWRHVCLDLQSIQVSVEGNAASMLRLNIEPSEFEWIDTQHVKSFGWKWNVHASYLNNRLLNMEPLVEPMTMHIKVWQVVGSTPLQVEVKSADEVKFNWTHALLETVRLLTRMTMDKELASCVVKNETGVFFQYDTIHALSMEQTCEMVCGRVWTAAGPTDVAPGQELPLQPSTTVHIRFPEYKQLEIPTSELGTRTYRLSSTTLGPSTVDCVIDIHVQHGCKMIVVQSTWLFDNKTATRLQVQLIFPTGGIMPRPPFSCSLDPHQSLAVPMSLVSFRGTQVYVKPDGVHAWTLVDAPVVSCGDGGFVLYATWTAENESNRRVLSFCAPLVLHNALPTPMEYRLTSAPGRYESGKLGIGEKCVYHGSQHDSLTLNIRTKGFSWSQSTELVAGTIAMIDPMNHSVLLVTIDVESSKSSQWEVTVFVPYWVLNQTGLELEYQHELAFLGPEHINPFAAGQAMPKGQDVATLPLDTELVVPQPAVKRKHQLLPSIPPNRGLVDLIPKKVSIASTASPLLAVCHTHQRHGILKLQLRLQGKGAAWSNVISCHIRECTIRDNGRVYVVGFVLEHGQGWYDRTQVLTLVPRFLLINALDDRSLDILMDESTATSATLDQNAQLPWHFTQAHHRNAIRIRFTQPGWVWSGALNLQTTGDQTLRLRNTVDRTTYLIRVSIKLEGPQYRIVFRSSTNVPPYRIENFSLETIRIHQSRVRTSDILLPHQTCDYTWDEPLKPHLVVVDMLPSQADDNSRPIRIGVFSMDDITQFPTKALAVEVRADGPTRVLRLTDMTPFPKPHVAKKEPTGWQQYLMNPVVEFQLKLHSISVSLVDSKPSELVYVSWNTVGFQAAWTQHMAQLALHVTVHSMQIDNQVRTTRYPVLLNFTESPAMDATIVRETTYTSIEFLRYVNVKLQPMRWRIDGTLIHELATMFVSPEDVRHDTAPTREDRVRDFDASTVGVLGAPPETTMSKKLYFEKFELAPIQATLSFATSSAPTTSRVVQVAGVRQILQAAGKTLTKIHNAPLHWRALRWQHMFVPRETMLNQMSLHYQHEAYRQAYVLLGSVDVLGNPVKVWQNLRGGLASFVWEPVPFGFGLIKGTSLLFRAFVYAVLDFNTRIASSMLLGLSDACQRIDTYTGYPVAKTLYQDIAQGASGVVSPMYAYDLQGWSGIVPGVLAGMLGLVLKPLRGFTQAFVTTTTTLRDGIQHDTQSYSQSDCSYIDPRTHLLTSYSYVHASGEDIKYGIIQARHEDYVGHVMSAKRHECLLVTKHRVLSLQVHLHPHHAVAYTISWEVLSDDLIVVAYANPETIVLYHKPRDVGDLAVPTQVIELPPTQALSVYYMLQQMTATILNQSGCSQLNVHFVDKCRGAGCSM
ncbi:hypothetical protein DYB32_000921 [Aphanomyces invadans]|uniref:Uncharacterized protein n=1 Tax=Aphanomyces invadans TaxID=157072 RepID=A0A3R6ZWH5_9STRA|nr:hypothetical protein DYB32_000921 [Aphanomyces invadans]